MAHTEEDIQSCLQVLLAGGILLFATDYGWSLGCDATNESAVEILLGHLPGSKLSTFPVLLAEERDVLQWVATADLLVFDYTAEQARPTAIVFEHGLGFATNLPAPDGSVLICLTQNTFCRHLVKRFRKPVVAVPCNYIDFAFTQSGSPTALQPAIVRHISQQDDSASAFPLSLQVLYWNGGEPIVEDYL